MKTQQTEKNNKTLKKLLPKAQECFNLETFETRHSDGLDFYVVPVWKVKEAMLYAYSIGIEDTVGRYLEVIQKLEEENQQLKHNYNNNKQVMFLCCDLLGVV